MRWMSATVLCAALLGAAGSGVARATDKPTDARVVERHRLGGPGGWDYLALDAEGKRLFISRSDHVQVVDAASVTELGTIADTPGVHGIAFDPQLQRGYTSNGKADSVSVFDLRTLKTLDTIKVSGSNPDAILFDPPTRHVWTFNGRSHNATVIDTQSGKVVATVDLPGKPEFGVSDGRGRIYVNIEDTGQLVALDAATATVIATWSLAPGEEPTGLALDVAHQRLFAACSNARMIVLDAQSGMRVADLPIGKGSDGAAFDSGLQRAYASNGDGSLTVIAEDDADHFRVLESIPTQKGARTLTIDPHSHRIFTVSAEFGPAPAASPENPHPRPAPVADSFVLLVVH